MTEIKPWSISTTVRNPHRMRGFLSAIADLEGEVWNKEAQIKFQIELIRRKLYGAGSSQFSNGLSPQHQEILSSADDLTTQDAQRIFDEKQYEDPPMRGRTSFKPLEKFGFVCLGDRKLQITASGKEFLMEDVDFSEILLRSLVKWQLPNPIEARSFPEEYGYNIKPFVGTLHLIKRVNALCVAERQKPKGISFFEFGLFAITLIDHQAIEQTACDIMEFRKELSNRPKNKQDAYLHAAPQTWRPNFVAKNMRDYTDNTVRYFRTTGLIRVRGSGYYIDIEPLRQVETDSLLDWDSGKPDANIDYGATIANPQLPELPWETPTQMTQSALTVINHLNKSGQVTDLPKGFEKMTLAKQKMTLEKLRKQMREWQKEKAKNAAKDPKEIQNIIKNLRALMDKKTRIPNKPTYLEHWTALALMAINDAITIHPNYPLGDDGMPTNTAPAGKADIECHYKNFKMVCEVTLQRDKLQWVNEGQPVLRHTHEFAQAHPSAEIFCLFVAPQIHIDTANIFWVHIRSGYESQEMRVVPITISDLCDILEFCAQCYSHNKVISYKKWKELLICAVGAAENHDSASQWVASMSSLIEKWKGQITA
ncbi:MAG: AlwI family type II restriction endonuclease [Parvibaculales bacterium]